MFTKKRILTFQTSRLKTETIIILLILLMCIFVGCRKEMDANMKSENEQILEDARRFLDSKGLSTKGKIALFDIKNEEWEKTTEFLKNEKSHIKTLELLANKDFQAVRFSPSDKLTLGGEYWVFVDKKSKTVIGFLAFK